jgi:hypothetical protein
MGMYAVCRQQKQPMLATEKDGSSSGDPSSVQLASQSPQASQHSFNMPPLNQQTIPRPLRRFSQRSVVCILLPSVLHSDRSWSGLSGWKIVMTAVVNQFSKRRRARQTLTRLWLILFVLSTLSWSFALPGLTLQTENAFVVEKPSGAAVLGLNASDFYKRSTLQFMTEV